MLTFSVCIVNLKQQLALNCDRIVEFLLHWQIQQRVPGTHTPGPISIIFMQFSAKNLRYPGSATVLFSCKGLCTVHFGFRELRWQIFACYVRTHIGSITSLNLKQQQKLYFIYVCTSLIFLFVFVNSCKGGNKSKK